MGKPNAVKKQLQLSAIFVVSRCCGISTGTQFTSSFKEKTTPDAFIDKTSPVQFVYVLVFGQFA